MGLTLGLYSRVGWLSLTPGARGDRSATLAARQCPQFTSPVSHQRNRDCIVCGNCLKAGGPEAVVVQLDRWPGAAHTAPALTAVEALAVSLLLGLLTVDSLRMTPLYLSYMTWALPTIGNYRATLTVGGLALMGVMLAGHIVTAAWLGGKDEGPRVFRHLGFSLIPLALALHLALSARRLFADGPAALQGVGIELGLLPAGHLPPTDAYAVRLPLLAVRLLLLALGIAGTAYLSGQGSTNLRRWERILATGTPGLALGVILAQPMSAAC